MKYDHKKNYSLNKSEGSVGVIKSFREGEKKSNSLNTLFKMLSDQITRSNRLKFRRKKTLNRYSKKKKSSFAIRSLNIGILMPKQQPRSEWY